MTAWRWQTLGLSGICFLFAAIDGGFSGQDLWHLVHDFREQRPVIASAHYLLSGLLLTPLAVTVGLLFLLSKPVTPEQMKRAANSSSPWSGRYMIFLAACLGGAMIAPVVQYLLVDHLAVARGYRLCPTPDWPRHQPDRWALPDPRGGRTLCPVKGADPNA